jgi:YNFM family putative membrane transporter
MIRLTLAVMLTGMMITMASSLAVIVAGVGLFTCGFFSAHAIASSWVGRRARTAKAQASSLYLFAYYLGSSISGTLGGVFWLHGGWQGVAVMITLLIVAALLTASLLLRMPVRE